MTDRFEEIPGWTFESEEIAAGIYEVIGKDRDGREVRITGTADVDRALTELRERAMAIDAEGRHR